MQVASDHARKDKNDFGGEVEQEVCCEVTRLRRTSRGDPWITSGWLGPRGRTRRDSSAPRGQQPQSTVVNRRETAPKQMYLVPSVVKLLLFSPLVISVHPGMKKRSEEILR